MQTHLFVFHIDKVAINILLPLHSHSSGLKDVRQHSKVIPHQLDFDKQDAVCVFKKLKSLPYEWV